MFINERNDRNILNSLHRVNYETPQHPECPNEGRLLDTVCTQFLDIHEAVFYHIHIS